MPEQQRRRLVSPALIALCATIVLLVATGLYNNAAAPPSGLKNFAELIPLGDANTAVPSGRIEITGTRPVVGSHYLFDPEAKLVYPIKGGAPQPLAVGTIGEAVADGDNFVWVERNGTTAIRYFDQARGTTRAVQVPPLLEPLDGTLRAGGGVVGWSYLRADNTTAIAAFGRANGTIVAHASAFSENRTLVAAVGTDLFFSKRLDKTDLWLLNTTREREELLAFGPSVGRVATGVFFAAWINESRVTAEYFDIFDRGVRDVPPPVGVIPKWVLANDLTILFGGVKQGLIFSSPRVELYDFGTGNSQIYESIGVDFDASPYFGYADRTVVSLVIEVEKRPVAPLTAPLLLATVAAVATTGLLAVRDIHRADRDL